ncbi:MAG: transglycosylase SLT domain-containing protein [Thermodesulfobacteriota bacterium]
MKWLLSMVFLFHAVSQVMAASPAQQPQPAGTAVPGKPAAALPTTAQVWKGDFDGMMARRIIRVLVPYSRTLYFNDKGQESGITADLVREFERYVNRKYRKKLGNRPITVIIIPTSRDKLLPNVVTGLGDIAAGNLTVTDERLRMVDFVSPDLGRTVAEVVITGPNAKPVTRVEDLAGRQVHVRKSSSYYESLVQLNNRFRQEKQPEMDLVAVPNTLEDEDMMEMVNAGLLNVIIVDDWKAEIWQKILPRMTVNKQVALRTGGRTGWAIRKQHPGIVAELNDFYNKAVKKQASIIYRLAQYNRRIKQIYNSTGKNDWQRFGGLLTLFQKYGHQYGFDPLMLAAQGYQESRLQQKARSPSGAVGVMQVLPSTGKYMKVGDVRVLEPNIHAGAKYMDHLMKEYFQDATFSEMDRTLFAFAAYNAGPNRIAKIRKEAAKQGLDPNQWFNHVEIVTAKRVGMETTTYVRNIYKYYIAYKLTLEAQEQQAKAREQLKSNQ